MKMIIIIMIIVIIIIGQTSCTQQWTKLRLDVMYAPRYDMI